MKRLSNKTIAIIGLLALSSSFVVAYPGETHKPIESVKDSVRVDEIVVTGTRTSATTNNLPMSVSVVSELQMQSRMEQSVLPVLVERVPGLFITSRSVMGYGASTGSAGAMTMRGVGGNGAQMLMLIDGHPQYMGLMGHPLADTYQTLMTERMEVVRGPASVLYGSNAMGGVINILTRQQKEDGVNTRLRAMYGSYNTVSTEAINTTRFGKFNSVLSFGYNRSDGHRDNMDFEQFSGYGKLGYDFSTHWKSFVDLNLSKTNSTNPGSESVPMLDNDMDIVRGITSVSLQNEYERTSGAFKLYYNWGDHFINDGYRAEGGSPRDSRFNSTDWMLGITLYQNYSLFQGNQTTVGIDYQRYGGHAWTSYINDNEDVDLAKEYVNDIAGYVNFQQMLWDKLTFNAGVRFDHHSVTGNEWIPQFGLNYFAGPNTTVKGIVSKGYRNPTVRELYMFGNRNPDLEPESLMNYEVALNQSLLDSKLQFEINLYYIKGKNSIILVPAEEGPGMWRNTGKLENYGLELAADYRITPRLGVNANYSYLHMKNEIPASPEHKFYAGLDYSLHKWMFSTGLQYVHHLILDDGKESFALWNARVTYKATKCLDVFARGENLLDQNYQMYTGYPMPGATVFGGVAFKF